MSVNLNSQAADLRARESFEFLKNQIEELNSDELLQINVNIPVAIATVLRAAPQIDLLRREIYETIPNFNDFYLLFLERYAWALRHAHSVFLQTNRPLYVSAEIEAELSDLRDAFYKTASARAQSCKIDAAPLIQLSYLNDHRNLANDVLVLATLIKGNWEAFKNSERTPAELDRAVTLSELLLHSNAQIALTPAIIAAADMRARAFTLLFRAYDDVRSAIQYLRRHKGDANEIAPSLFVRLYSPDASERELPQVMPFEDDLETSVEAQGIADDLAEQRQLKAERDEEEFWDEEEDGGEEGDELE